MTKSPAYWVNDVAYKTVAEAQEAELTAFILRGLPDGGSASAMAAFMIANKPEVLALLTGRAKRKYAKRNGDKKGQVKP